MSEVGTEYLVRDFSQEELEALGRQFSGADPFPHLVIDDVLSPKGVAALRNFPDPDWQHWCQFRDEYQKGKRTCDDIGLIPEPFSTLIRECSDPRFLNVLESLTGLTRLLPDPYLDGGGLHSSGSGGVLAPHTDFHFYRRLSLYRMINLLIYFNDPWTEDDGGMLELYREGEATPSVSVAPTFGRAVLFRTDDKSVHGFTKPIASGKWRNSVALYYYSSRETSGFSGDTTTHWRSHGAKLVGARLNLFDGLIFTSRLFSKLAHIVNPNSARPD